MPRTARRPRTRPPRVKRRYLDDRESAKGPRARVRGWHGRGDRTVYAGLSTGQSTLQRGASSSWQKDTWNAAAAQATSRTPRRRHPELAGCSTSSTQARFPNLAAYTKPRADLEAILLTGIPAGVVSLDVLHLHWYDEADMLRLNLAIPPASTPNPLGVVGGDVAGFPNGRRVTDDVVTIELLAVAGATIPLVDKTFTPDKALRCE